MDSDCPYASRGGLKLAHALKEFHIDVAGLACADLGCSTGGFTDCLLQHGAASVISVDTAYGEFAWKLRNDPRVILRERTNALHASPPETPVDLVVVDLGWTKQKHLIPVALRWLKPSGRIITLIKPHYEQEGQRRKDSVLDEAAARQIVDRVLVEIAAAGATVESLTQSPILGGAKGASKSKGSGNPEWLALVRPAPAPSSP